MAISSDTKVAIGVGLALLIGGLLVTKKLGDAVGSVTGAVSDVFNSVSDDIEAAGGIAPYTQNVAYGATNVVDGAVSGVVYGIGDKFGVPRTDMNACELAIRDGRTWDASYMCTPKRFIEYLANGK